MQRAEDPYVNKVKTMMRMKIASGLLFGALALSPGLGLAADDGHSLEQVVVEMATTPAQHAALAQHYRAKAADAKAEARHHESMGNAYTGGKFVQRKRMKDHCQSITEKYSGLATEYEALANLHEELAKP